MFTVTVPARTAAVTYRHGTRTGVLPAGRHRRTWGTRYVRVDLREGLLTLAPQEVPTADGVTVKVSLAVRWSVADPAAWIEESRDPLAVLHLAAQLTLREAVAALDVTEVASRAGALRQLAGPVAAAAAAVGVAVHDVVVKDVVLPADLRAAALELLTVRRRGAAQLEAARAETAALRAMANTARLLEDHPALARLRTVQTVPPGSEVVVHLGAEA